MKTVQLTGRLSKLFGETFKFDIASPAEAVRALCIQIPGFENALREGSYRLTRIYKTREEEFDETEITLNFGKATGVRIEPIIAGSKGTGKLILGVVLIGSAFFFSGGALGATAFSIAGAGVSFGQVALFGGSLLLAGVSSLLAPDIQQQTDVKRDEVKSFLFEGPQNLVEQGNPVPLVFGTMHTGSVLISAGISSEELPV